MRNNGQPHQLQQWQKRIDAIKAKREAQKETDTESDISLAGLSPEEQAIQVRLLAKRAAFQRESAAAAPKPTEAYDRAYVRDGNVKERLLTPVVPSREQAHAAGMQRPDSRLFMLSMGLFPAIEGVHFPEEPDSVYKIAYELLPAWVAEYGHRYSAKPHMVLKMWLQAINKDVKEDVKDERTFREQRIEPWQLQGVVFHMSENGEQFNPREMSVVAKKIYGAGDETKWAIQENFTKRNPFYYEVFRSVNPDDTSKPTTVQAWSSLAGYPDQFPTDITVPAETLKAINHAVQDRYESDKQVCSTCGRWLAEEMLQVVQHFLRDKGTTFTPQHILELAYRYSPAWIQSASMCKDRSHENRAAFRNHLDDAPRSKGFDVSDMNLNPKP